MDGLSELTTCINLHDLPKTLFSLALSKMPLSVDRSKKMLLLYCTR
jgi:hypothetical protein